ncbi:expressed protein [Phakopsora pachyrhizi]|uniref:Expressed protein n=1 Tax=Phakopsora pachyrhizi TaxID=170000 RepID=A0AAV0AU48_PHAPC|nr:expressed protein [Phakopsora pachyrhizi]
MRPNGCILDLEWLRLINIFLMSSLIHGNLGSLEFFKASRLTSGSHMIDLNHPTPQHGNLINPSIGERYLEIPPKKRFKNHESNTGSLRIAKFDLNELPEDTGSEMSHKHHDEISELGSEKDSVQTSKSHTIEPAHGTISLADSKSSSADIGYVSSEPASDQDQRINDSDFVRDLSDFYTIRRSMNKPRRRYDQKDKKQHSLKRLKGTNSLHSKKSSTKSVAKNRKRKKSDDSEEQDLSREVKGKNKMSIFIMERAKYKVKKNLSAHYLKSFKTSLTTKVKNPGPFDLQGEKAYRSPYNRVLLGYIKKNLKNILPVELSKYEISASFLQVVKNFFWNKVDGLFFLSEESFKVAILSVHCESPWVTTSTLKSASGIFCFPSVFTRFLSYEKVSRFFLNDEMRQAVSDKFMEFNSKLLESESGSINIRSGIRAKILNQTWSRMIGFLAYVHAFNAIVIPKDTKPLSHQQLVKQQKKAIDFFFQLHEKVEISWADTKGSEIKYIRLKNFTDKSDFEEEKQKVMKEIFNSHLRSDNAPWLYIELWMIECRPSLYKIMKNSPNREQKFKSLTNRVFLLLFSGMYSYTKLI